MLSFKLHTRIGEQDLLLPCTGHIVFTTVAGQGWLAGPKPSLDACRRLAESGGAIKLILGAERACEQAACLMPR
jgi:hypothetical protein